MTTTTDITRITLAPRPDHIRTMDVTVEYLVVEVRHKGKKLLLHLPYDVAEKFAVLSLVGLGKQDMLAPHLGTGSVGGTLNVAGGA